MPLNNQVSRESAEELFRRIQQDAPRNITPENRIRAEMHLHQAQALLSPESTPHGTTAVGRLFQDALSRLGITPQEAARLLGVKVDYFRHLRRGAICASISDKIIKNAIEHLGIPAAKMREQAAEHNAKVKEYREGRKAARNQGRTAPPAPASLTQRSVPTPSLQEIEGMGAQEPELMQKFYRKSELQTLIPILQEELRNIDGEIADARRRR